MTATYQKLYAPDVTRKMSQKLVSVFESGNWKYGHYAKRLEVAIAKILDVPEEWVICTDSATDALAAFQEMRMPSGRVCPLTWPATYAAMKAPEYVDCDMEGWPVGPVDVGVELWGRPWPAHLPFPRLLDAAHRFGDARHGQLLKEGKIEALVYSFGPVKELASFSGGALITRDTEALRSYLFYGTAGRVRVSTGRHGLMREPSAAMILQQLPRHPVLRQRRQEILQWYEHHLGAKAMLTRVPEACGHVAVYDCQTPLQKQAVLKALGRAPQIETGHHYPLSLEQQIACPGAAVLSDRVISLPCHTRMAPKDDVRRIVHRVLAA